MTPQETTIVAIAELINTKQALISQMKFDMQWLKSKIIKEVVVRTSDENDDHYLFDSQGLEQEILDDALVDRLEWIIDNVYDRAIGMAQDRIDAKLNELKQNLLNNKETI